MWRVHQLAKQLCQNRHLCYMNIHRRFTSSQALLQCIRCATVCSHSDIISFFCKSCQWPVESRYLMDMDPFDIFTLPKVYKIDKGELNKRFKESQFALHPDKHASKAEEELHLVTKNSSIINGHYRTLVDDKARAKLLYSIRYGEEKFNEEVDKSDPDELAEVMEVHERLHTLRTSEEAKQMCKEAEAVINEAICGLNVAFEQDDADAVMKHFKRMSFYRQILQKALGFNEDN